MPPSAPRPGCAASSPAPRNHPPPAIPRINRRNRSIEMPMQRFALSLALVILATSAHGQSQAPSPYYPAPPPVDAPKVEQGQPPTGLSSPLDQDQQKVTRTVIDSDAEAAPIAGAVTSLCGPYARVKGAKPGEVADTEDAAVWRATGRIDSTAPGTEGGWAAIDGVVERISAGSVQIRGEVAFRVAKVMK